MKLFIDALGASAGGGLTYLWNVLPHLAEHPKMKVSVLADPAAALCSSGNLSIIEGPKLSGSARRFLWEQTEIPKLIRKNESEVLLCTGNFAIWNCPVPQILLSRNSLYTSPDFSRDLRCRGEYRLLGETRVKGMLARKSIRRADITISPSEAFARELEKWAGRNVAVVHHGFDAERFLRDTTELPSPVQKKLQAAEGTLSLLFVSHYNYYRNFETLFRALALLKERLAPRKVRLVLTCELADGANPGSYRTEQARTLVRKLEIEDDIVQLGAVDYFHLHHVYRASDLYVTPAYTETFAHPLVEAMASGLPIVASNISVHREIASGAALFFEKFSPSDLAEKVIELVNSPSRRSELRGQGLQQARRFSWKKHVERLVEMAASLSSGLRRQ